jgi:hypothetical protein
MKIKTKAELALEKALLERGLKQGEKPKKKKKGNGK